MHIANFLTTSVLKNICERLINLLLQQFICFKVSFYNYKEEILLKEMLIEIRLCNPMTYIFKGDVKIVKIYMVKFNVLILNRLKIMFFVNTKYMHKHNDIFNKTVTKLATIMTKGVFFSISEPYKLP